VQPLGNVVMNGTSVFPAVFLGHPAAIVLKYAIRIPEKCVISGYVARTIISVANVSGVLENVLALLRQEYL